MIVGIILAAGKSSRMGIWKPAIKIDGTPLIIRAIQPMLGVTDRIVVVGGHRFEDLKNLLSGFFHQVQIVKNENYETGEMFSSVKTGVGAIADLDVERFFILPGDHPFIKETTYSKLLSSAGEVVVPSFKNRKGHPILLKGSLAEPLLREPENSNLREFTKKFKIEIVEVGDPGILVDIDTMEDLERGKDIKTG